MEATDFRIGNLIECDGNILEVVRIAKSLLRTHRN
jgi:translation elongation factor P/translation initiation factor 5A